MLGKILNLRTAATLINDYSLIMKEVVWYRFVLLFRSFFFSCSHCLPLKDRQPPLPLPGTAPAEIPTRSLHSIISTGSHRTTLSGTNTISKPLTSMPPRPPDGIPAADSLRSAATPPASPVRMTAGDIPSPDSLSHAAERTMSDCSDSFPMPR